MQSPIAGGLSGARRAASSVLGSATFASSLARKIAAIEDKNTAEVLQQNQIALASVNNTLARVGNQMVVLNNSLLAISQLTAQSAALENLKERQKKQQERLLAQQQLREGKESIIEKKIQATLVKPVQKIAGSAQKSLFNLMEFFNRLFFGWLLNQGLQTISALATGNKEKLEQIKDNVLKNLSTVGLTLLALQGGFKIFRGTLFRIAGFIAKASLVGLFLRPIKALLSAVMGIAEKVIPKPVMDTLKYAMSLVSNSLPFSPAGAIAGGDSPAGVGSADNNDDGGGDTTATQPQEEGGFNVNIPALMAGGAIFGKTFMATPGHPFLKFAVASAVSLGAEQIIENMFPEYSFDLEKLFGGGGQEKSAEGLDAAAEVSMKPQTKTDAAAAQVSAPLIEDKSTKIGEEPKAPTKVSFVELPADTKKASTRGRNGLANMIPAIASANVDSPYPSFGALTLGIIPT